MQKNNVYNKLCFCRTFFSIALYQISQNNAILIYHESFFQGKRIFTAIAFAIFGNKFFNG